MKSRIALMVLTTVAFAGGAIFQREIGVGTLRLNLGRGSRDSATKASLPRLASLHALAIPEKKIIFIGDSLIELQEWQEAFAVSNIINRGVSGAKIRDLTGRYDLSKARAVFSLVGINDLGEGASFEEFKVRYQKFLDTVPETVPFFSISIPWVLKYQGNRLDGALIESCNAFIMQATTRRAGVYINIFDISKQDGAAFHTADGVHFSTEAYIKIAAMLKPYVEKEAPMLQTRATPVRARPSG